MMNNIKEGLRWLDQAEADMKTAGDCLEDGNYYASAFFTQQSAKKALKGSSKGCGRKGTVLPTWKSSRAARPFMV